VNLSSKKEADMDNLSAAKIRSVSPCLIVTTIKHIEIQEETEKQVTFELMASWLQ